MLIYCITGRWVCKYILCSHNHECWWVSLNHPGCSLDTLKQFQSLTDTLAQWVEHHMQNQKVTGSIPASVTFPNQPQVRFVNVNVIPQLHEENFSTLYAMTMDYLPIQASSVSCEKIWRSTIALMGCWWKHYKCWNLGLNRITLVLTSTVPKQWKKRWITTILHQFIHQMLFLLIFLLNSWTSLVEARCRMS